MHDRHQRDAVLARRRTPQTDPVPRRPACPPNPPPPASRDPSQQNDRPPARPPTSTSVTPSRRADSWILQYHDVWSRLTLSSFYQDLQGTSLTPGQFARWLLDRASVSMAILEAATRANDIVRMSTQHHSPLPLHRIAKENAQFLAEYAVMNGLNINSQYRLSHAGKRLVDLIEASTAPDAPPVVAITAVWSYMFASWQAWALCITRRRTIPSHFETIANFISRDDSIHQLIATQEVLDQLLNSTSSEQQFEKAGKTFEEMARRSCAVLDHTLYMGEGNHVPLCTCGRKGHYPEQCTFKSHI